MQIEARHSRIKLSLYILGALTFVILGLAVFYYDEAALRFAGLASTGFFGLCLAVFIGKFLDREIKLIIDEQGIYYPRVWDKVIPWDEISAVDEIKQSGNTFLQVILNDPDYLPKKKGRFGSAEKDNDSFYVLVPILDHTQQQIEDALVYFLSLSYVDQAETTI